MSIIYDALQKTQRNRANNRDFYNQIKTKRRMFWLDMSLVLVIITLLVMVLVAYVPRVVKHFKGSVHTAAAPAASTVVRAVVTDTAADAQSTEEELTVAGSHGNLVLNGVLLSDDDKMALINNKTYHQGDYVDGMRVVDIEINKVKLQEGERIFVLRSTS